jgi:hypothetical protein
MLSFLAGTSFAVLLFSPHLLAQDVAITRAYQPYENQDFRPSGNQVSRLYENEDSGPYGNEDSRSVIMWNPFWRLKTTMDTIASYTVRRTFTKDFCSYPPGANLILII